MTRAASNVRLLTDEAGRLLLVLSFPGTTPAETAWSCLWTSGHRTLRGLTGTCVHDGRGDRSRQVAAAARARLRDGTPPIAQQTLGAAVGKWLMPAHPDPVADALVARFREACGAATLRAALLGAPSLRLAPLDRRFGPAAVDAAFGSVPLLASLALHPGASDIPVELADAFHAHAAGEGLPEALVLLARRLAGTGAPNGGHAFGEDDPDPFADPGDEAGAGAHHGLDDLGDDFLEDLSLEDLSDDEADWGVRGPAHPDAVTVAEIPGLPRGDPSAVAALMTRLGAACVPIGLAPALIRETAWIPRDWLPRDADEAACCAEVLSLAHALALESGGTLDPMTLVAPSRGLWRRYAGLLARANPLFVVRDPRSGPAGNRIGARMDRSTLVFGVRDMVRRFVDQLARPAAAWASGGASGPVEGRRDIHLAAWRILFRDKGLSAVLQASGEWHARRMEMDRLVRTLSDGRQWPRPFPDFKASNGMVATPLLSAQELAEEGAALLHCVGDYADACHAGRSVVVSLRGTVDGREARSSTLELEWPPRGPEAVPRIVQHRGRLNGDPGPEDIAAAAELVAHVGSDRRRPVIAGRVAPIVRAASPTTLSAAWQRRVRALADRIDPPAARRDPGADPRPHAGVDGHRLSVQCGYDWRDTAQTALAHGVWCPFLPRDLRGSPEDLAAALGVASGDRSRTDAPIRARSPALDALSGLANAHLRLASACVARIPRPGRQTPLLLVAFALAVLIALGLRPGHSPDPPSMDERPAGLGERLRRLVERSPTPCREPDGTVAAGTCTATGPLRVVHLGSAHPAGSYRISFAFDGTPPVTVVDVVGGVERWAMPAWRDWAIGKLAETDPEPAPGGQPVP